MPSIALRPATIALRRRSKATFISSTAVNGPETAARAAIWGMLDTFDVAWDWRLVAALMTSAGPIIQPTRQPVMAYVLATPLRITTLSPSSGTAVAIEVNGTPS